MLRLLTSVDARTQLISRAGIPLKRLKKLVEAWLGFDWRKKEAELNHLPQFKTRIEDIDLHFLHKPSSRSDATPLILCHGWPGSFVEFGAQILDPLTEPDDPSLPAFHCVVPSMPGYTFSSPPSSTKWQMDDTARVYDELMRRLGYDAYVAQGGDWGSITARLLGALYSDRCRAVHLNFVPALPPWPFNALPIPPIWVIKWLPGLTPVQKERVVRMIVWEKEESGYTKIQGTKPATLSYGLNDSPLGLLAWVGEKFEAWQEGEGKGELKLDDILTNVSLYWYTQCIGSSFAPYKDNRFFTEYIHDKKYYLSVPTGYSAFPGEILLPPEHYIGKTCNLRWQREASRGGHFASSEVPDIFVPHIRDAFRELLS